MHSSDGVNGYGFGWFSHLRFLTALLWHGEHLRAAERILLWRLVHWTGRLGNALRDVIPGWKQILSVA